MSNFKLGLTTQISQSSVCIIDFPKQNFTHMSRRLANFLQMLVRDQISANEKEESKFKMLWPTITGFASQFSTKFTHLDNPFSRFVAGTCFP